MTVRMARSSIIALGESRTRFARGLPVNLGDDDGMPGRRAASDTLPRPAA